MSESRRLAITICRAAASSPAREAFFSYAALLLGAVLLLSRVHHFVSPSLFRNQRRQEEITRVIRYDRPSI
jgi:hypothetical protein